MKVLYILNQGEATSSQGRSSGPYITTAMTPRGIMGFVVKAQLHSALPHPNRSSVYPILSVGNLVPLPDVELQTPRPWQPQPGSGKHGPVTVIQEATETLYVGGSLLHIGVPQSRLLWLTPMLNSAIKHANLFWPIFSVGPGAGAPIASMLHSIIVSCWLIWPQWHHKGAEARPWVTPFNGVTLLEFWVLGHQPRAQHLAQHRGGLGGITFPPLHRPCTCRHCTCTRWCHTQLSGGPRSGPGHSHGPPRGIMGFVLWEFIV